MVTPQAVREDNYAAATVRGRDYASLRDKLKAEPELVILFDDSYQGDDLPFLQPDQSIRQIFMNFRQMRYHYYS